MNNVLIILSGEIENINLNLEIKNKKINYIVAVDGGYNHLVKQNINPNIIIGDFDSINFENKLNSKIQKYPTHKDYSDFNLSIKYVQNKIKYNKIYVYGFMSLNRLDHILSNISNIDENMIFISKNQRLEFLKSNKEYIFKRDKYKYFSFFSLQTVNNLNLSGFEYNLENYLLEPFDPLCLSNYVKDDYVKIKYSDGKLLLIKSFEN